MVGVFPGCRVDDPTYGNLGFGHYGVGWGLGGWWAIAHPTGWGRMVVALLEGYFGEFSFSSLEDVAGFYFYWGLGVGDYFAVQADAAFCD